MSSKVNGGPAARGHDFDALAPRYDRGLAWGLFWLGGERRLRLGLLSRLGDPPPGSRVLEVGCGTGANLKLLGELRPALSLTGIDLSAGMLAVAARKAFSTPVSLARGDAARLPFAPGSFDGALAVFSLHEMPAETRRGAAAELFRVLRPGGALLVADFIAPATGAGRLPFALLRLVESRETLAFAAAGPAPLLEPCGFRRERAERVLLGLVTVELFRKPG